MKKINAIGQTCPIPVIMTKNALKDINLGKIEVSVDNKISKENIEKFSKEMGFIYSSRKENEIYIIEIEKNIISENNANDKISNEVVVVISSDKMGDGDISLGEILMKGFLYTLTEMEQLPKSIIFYNKGVFLTTKNETIIKDLKTLEKKGVEILSCGACLNFYELDKNLNVGTTTNMYSIIEKQMRAIKVIKP